MKKTRTLYVYKVTYLNLWGERLCDLVACYTLSTFALRKQLEREYLYVYDVELLEQCYLYE